MAPEVSSVPLPTIYIIAFVDHCLFVFAHNHVNKFRKAKKGGGIQIADNVRSHKVLIHIISLLLLNLLRSVPTFRI